MIKVNASTGRVHGARWHRSPNCDERPHGMTPELLVLHCISLPPRQFGGRYIDALFTNCLDTHSHASFCDLAGVNVSAHVLIRRDGDMVQFVSLNQRAWHAGPSSFAGREACNDFSIGIELEGCEDVPYQPIQYLCLSRLYVALVEAYPAIATNPVVGHSDIAPGRKTDPGPSFDWRHFVLGVARTGTEPPQTLGRDSATGRLST